MKFKIQNHYTHDDRMFLVVEIIITLVCMFMPFILFWADDLPKFRNSISAYVDMNNSYIFGLLLGVAGMTFLLNGALYFKVGNDINRNVVNKVNDNIGDKSYDKKLASKWYNLVFGIALIGVATFHYDKTPLTGIFHTIFALIFFVGSAIVIFFNHDPRDKWKNKILAIISVACLVVAYLSDGKLITLFWAETIALIIIAIHYILESFRICLHFD